MSDVFVNCMLFWHWPTDLQFLNFKKMFPFLNLYIQKASPILYHTMPRAGNITTTKNLKRISSETIASNAKRRSLGSTNAEALQEVQLQRLKEESTVGINEMSQDESVNSATVNATRIQNQTTDAHRAFLFFHSS